MRSTISPPLAVALAASAYVVPLALRVGANPAPTIRGCWLGTATLRKPWFKPPDAAIPAAWTAIETLLGPRC